MSFGFGCSNKLVVGVPSDEYGIWNNRLVKRKRNVLIWI